MLIDFGFATSLNKGDMLRKAYGTPLYSAPEILTNQPYDLSADVFSYGVLIVYMIHCFAPYDDIEMDNQTLLKSIVSGSLRPTTIEVDEKDIDFSTMEMDDAIYVWTELALAQLAEACWTSKPSHRPQMNSVLPVVKEVVRMLVENEFVVILPSRWIQEQLEAHGYSGCE